MTDEMLPGSEKSFIIEKAVNGFGPEEIHYMLKNEEGSFTTLETVENFLNKESTRKEIELAKRVEEKKADVDRDELVSDLKEIKEGLKEEIAELRESNLNDISNDTMKNLINNIKLMGEFIDELNTQDNGNGGGVVNVNKLEQNFDVTKTIQYMPPEEKRSVAEQLAEDEDVEDFVIVRKDDEEDESEEGEDGENESSEEDVEEEKVEA